MNEQNYQNDFFLEQGMRRHIVKTLGWMALGLFVTAASAAFFYVSNIYSMLYLTFGGMITILSVILQVGVVFALCSRLTERSVASTRTLFFVYALITGFTFSVFAYAYDVQSIAIAFGITAVYFGSLTVIGYTTKINLMKFGPLLYVSLLVLIVVQVVLLFVHAGAETMMFTMIGLLIFTGLTAYDVQKMKVLYLECQDEEMRERLSVYSALELYLDFINMFLYILRIVGNRD
ncbi:MAG: Bax inhibitor-1/YccA family protein [Merdibacter sp.]